MKIYFCTQQKNVLFKVSHLVTHHLVHIFVAFQLELFISTKYTAVTG